MRVLAQACSCRPPAAQPPPPALSSRAWQARGLACRGGNQATTNVWWLGGWVSWLTGGLSFCIATRVDRGWSVYQVLVSWSVSQLVSQLVGCSVGWLGCVGQYLQHSMIQHSMMQHSKACQATARGTACPLRHLGMPCLRVLLSAFLTQLGAWLRTGPRARAASRPPLPPPLLPRSTSSPVRPA